LCVTGSTCPVDTVRSIVHPVEHEEPRRDALHACGYLSRLVELPVAVTEPMFDDATQSLGAPVEADPTAIGTVLLPARRVRTRLGSSIPWAGVHVEVELAPWSRNRTQVGVRYGGSRRPHAVARYVYVKRAPALLDHVTDAINARLPGAATDRQAA
jgi:hypothetical protein